MSESTLVKELRATLATWHLDTSAEPHRASPTSPEEVALADICHDQATTPPVWEACDLGWWDTSEPPGSTAR